MFRESILSPVAIRRRGIGIPEYNSAQPLYAVFLCAAFSTSLCRAGQAVARLAGSVVPVCQPVQSGTMIGIMLPGLKPNNRNIKMNAIASSEFNPSPKTEIVHIFPDRREYGPWIDGKHPVLSDLPFTSDDNAWEPRTTLCPEQGYLLGLEYAAHFVEFVKGTMLLDGNNCALGKDFFAIVQAMNLQDPAQQPVIRAFFDYIERLIAQATELEIRGETTAFQDLDRVMDIQQEIAECSGHPLIWLV